MLPSTETLNPSPSTQILAAVSTTTVFTSPTNVPATDSSSHSSGSTTLIGPIVGGVLGGVLLAIIAVLVWHYWGKAIKQKEEEKRNEMLAFLNLRENTRRNAAAALQKGHNSYTPGSPPALQAGRTEKDAAHGTCGQQQPVCSSDPTRLCLACYQTSPRTSLR
ncbi:hypothetical protein BC835DRAFT_1048150 [Cytidiella melzeri]|nr:hypothetical protein BC835DRAFT_1048150 [Cytidiella melzeri]